MGYGKKVHFYRGHYIYPGRIAGGTDDVLGTWYVVHEHEDMVDTRGCGHSNLAAAKRSIDEAVGESPWKYTKFQDGWGAVGHVEDKDWSNSEITIITRRGEEHKRKVDKVIWKSLASQGKALICVQLKHDAQVEHNAGIHYVDTSLDNLNHDLKAWLKHFKKMHNICRAHLECQKLEIIRSDIMNLLDDLQEYLFEYRNSSVPRKHPSTEWLEYKAVLDQRGIESSRV